MLRNVAEELAQAVADGLGIPLPKAMPRVVPPPEVEVTTSPALSLTARPGEGGVRGRKVAILVAGGVDAASVTGPRDALTEAGAVVRVLAARLGVVEAAGGDDLEPDATFETMPSVLFDAVVVPDGEEAAGELAALGHVLEFLRDQYRHCKPILIAGAGEQVLAAAGIPTDDGADWALTREVPAFAEAIGRHRNWDRATDPPTPV